MKDAFFSYFPGFQPNPSLPTAEEFSQLVKFASTEFAHYYEISNKLQNYRALCRELRLEGPFTSVTQCRKALIKVHVNIFGLIDSRRTGATVQSFPNQAALKKYTRGTQKIFPKQAAKTDGFLKELLRKIF
ncbi:uncharacterized protein BO87DRAFT_410183 [Aspergillus neoniger CBS 115656]|uniref:Uncharacterized protein n=1 Tax=Aspergillus neoniger (strain CBS 115656) TaxID=1448310 RepID=A0A318Y6J6_ASPNB|nr:hypothetical protein BO87DRAFT_410183 [Aspergillus neoniger CBS 115656]PYH29935.1 hypothetical protein BO87DRAFT_410183 [Aspergillus neoniger CBS 115656]